MLVRIRGPPLVPGPRRLNPVGGTLGGSGRAAAEAGNSGDSGRRREGPGWGREYRGGGEKDGVARDRGEGVRYWGGEREVRAGCARSQDERWVNTVRCGGVGTEEESVRSRRGARETKQEVGELGTTAGEKVPGRRG